MKEQAQADLVKVRETINLVIDGKQVDLRPTSALIDRVIKSLCSHDSNSWDSRSDDTGRIITTCERCGISWYEHKAPDNTDRQL